MTLLFELEDEVTLRNFRREVIEHRNVGRVHVEFRRWSGSDGASVASVANAFVKSLRLRAPDMWTDLEGPDALQAATRVLHLDLAYKAPVMPIDLARSLAVRFLDGCGERAAFLTNGSLGLSGTGQWSPLTDATFDTGIVGVAAKRVGLIWVEDED
jgi:hypothetical protein